MTKFTKKHYDTIADVINQVAQERGLEPVTMTQQEALLYTLVNRLTQTFARDNSSFSPTLFWDRCYAWSGGRYLDV